MKQILNFLGLDAALDGEAT
jgi:hypothetical protein